jgi:ketosteroid isomerase-like protein
MTHTETIQDLYAAFGRGDVQTILSHLSDDVDWDNSRVASKECPWNGNFRGKTRVPAFFEAVGENLDLSVFEPHTFVESGHHVVVLLHIEGQVKKNHHPLSNDSVHVWTFNSQGQVSGYRHFNDTAMELAAWKAQ